MKYLKKLGLGALLVAGMLVGAGGASASTLTQAPPYTGVVKAESKGAISWDGTASISCQKSLLEWGVEEHGAGMSITGALSHLTLEECGKDTVTVFINEHTAIELQATSSGNGTITMDGLEITAQVHRTVLGFPITTHCIYKTGNTHVGTFTGSGSTGGTAAWDIGSSPLPQVATDGACGNDAVLTGSYTFTSPDYLTVD
jgi:hypothetical protein